MLMNIELQLIFNVGMQKEIRNVRTNQNIQDRMCYRETASSDIIEVITVGYLAASSHHIPEEQVAG
jgi:hypothetical protein